MKKLAILPLKYILLLNLFLKLVFFLMIAPWRSDVVSDTILVSDSKGYHELALNILRNHSFAPVKDTADVRSMSAVEASGFIFSRSDTFRTPGYPLFLAAVYWLFGERPWTALLIQILLSLLTVVYVYKLSVLLFNTTQIAGLAALLFVLDIHSAYAANQLLTDTLFTFLFLSSVYFFLKGIYDKVSPFKMPGMGAFLLGLACLTRPIAFLYLIVPLSLLLVLPGKGMPQKIRSAVFSALIFAGIVCCWTSRNYVKYGHWSFSTLQGHSMFLNMCLLKSKIEKQPLDASRTYFQAKADSMGFRATSDVFQQAGIFEKVGIAYLMKHKLEYAKAHLMGAVNMFLSLGNRGMANSFGWSRAKPGYEFAELNPARISKNFNPDNVRETALGILIALLLAIQYLGSFLGLIQLKKERSTGVLLFFLLTILYFASLTGIVGMYRHKIPIVPLLCILAGAGLSSLFRSPKQL